MLMHSDILSDPLNPLTKKHKELTSKRKKTDQDHEDIAQSEWQASLYFTEELGPYIPSQNIEAAIREGAKLSKLGKAVQRSVEVLQLEVPLIYEGPRTIQGLWEEGFYDSRSVKVGQARLHRYRPVFKEWSAEFTIVHDELAMSESDVLKSLSDAGQYCGIGDYRPKFGRFNVEVI